MRASLSPSMKFHTALYLQHVKFDRGLLGRRRKRNNEHGIRPFVRLHTRWRFRKPPYRLVFVALGCPKQERWMQTHRVGIRAVMVGLGAAFPVYAGL